MARTILLPLACGMLLYAHARLAPQATAPLSAHLTEVNAQWRTMDPQPAGGGTPIAFADEPARIATHLRMVRERLLARMPEGLSAEQAARRTGLLERLDSYAADGIFPQNHALPHRNPVFIDPHGTACAVGWLMIESGHRDLVERISADMNLGYLHEIAADTRFQRPLAEWATKHGFTADELAWIQPGYPPTIPTFPLGGGTDGPVHALLQLPNGHVLVAGSFTEAGTVPANNLAAWDGASYQTFGDGIDGEARCAAWHDGTLYIGGRFQDGLSDLASWDGLYWSYQTISGGMDPVIHALHVHDGMLHAATEGVGFAFVMHQVMRLTPGTGWEFVGDPFNEAVLALTTFNGELVAGGAFTQPVSVTDPLMLRVARFDGFGWSQYADGLDAAVHAFLVRDGSLYAGGGRYDGNVYTFGLARIGAGGNDWEHLLAGLPVWPGETGTAQIETLGSMNNGVVFGGEFVVDQMMAYGVNMGFYDPSSGTVQPGIVHDGPVHTMLVSGNTLYYGGSFDISNMGPLRHVAYSSIITSVPGTAEEEALFVWPNPATDHVTIALPDGSPAPIRILDALGRTVEAPVMWTGDLLRIGTEGLAAGTYTVVIERDGRAVPPRFVKQ